MPRRPENKAIGFNKMPVPHRSLKGDVFYRIRLAFRQNIYFLREAPQIREDYSILIQSIRRRKHHATLLPAPFGHRFNHDIDISGGLAYTSNFLLKLAQPCNWQKGGK